MLKRKYSDELSIIANQNVKEKEYWLNRLSGELVKTSFLYDYRKEMVDQYSTALLEFRFSGELFSKLNKLSTGDDLKLNMILVTGVMVLLHKYSGNKDIIIGSPIYKQSIETEFINTILVLRNQLEANMTFKELLLEVRKTIGQANEHKNYPLEVLVDRLDIPVAADEFPFFDVAVLLENVHKKEYLHHVKPNVIFCFSRKDSSVDGILEYNPGLFHRETIARLIRHFTRLLELVLPDVNLLLGDLDILMAEERKEILFDFNNVYADVEYPKDKTLHQLFEEQAAKTPDNVSIVGKEVIVGAQYTVPLTGNVQLTYKELNEKSNRLAHFLRSRGVTSDTIVGVMKEPSIEMIVGLLGILKAGGAYLPIDSKTPTNRTISMLEESDAPILLTERPCLDYLSFRALQNPGIARVKPKVSAGRERITDMDRLPLPDRSLIDYDKYNRYIGYAGVKHTISLEATRGCPYGCTYCHKIFPRQQVSRSAEDIFAEVEYYYNLGVRRFSIIDDIFNLNIKTSSSFFKLMIKNGLKASLFFSAGLRGDILTKDYIDLMVEAGTVNMSPALETASPRLQRLINKNLNIEKFRENIEYICEKYPQVILELFVMHGFPTETEEEARQTLDFVKELKWVHFPYINILRIYSTTEMAKFAEKHGISFESIIRSEDLAWHELPETLPFPKSFTLKYQADFLENYFFCRERLIHVLPYQMQLMTEDELVQKYDSYLPMKIESFSRLLQVVEIKRSELGCAEFLSEDSVQVPGLNEKLKKDSTAVVPAVDALRILLLDLDLYFSQDTEMLYDLVDEPLGLIRLMTQLNLKFGNKINGRIAKSRIDFDNYRELKKLLEEFKPGLIGIRVLTFYRDFFHKTVSLIRQWGIDVPIIVGGPHVTTNYHEVLQDRNIDLAVLGEGEITLPELVEKILANDGELPAEEVLSEIPGLAFIPVSRKATPEFAREIIMLDEAEAILCKESTANPERIDGRDDLVYVIFTSGTTGRPKGVLVEHRNVVAYLHAFFYEFDIHEGHTVIQLASYTFDVFVEEVYPVLLRGGKIVIPGPDELMDIRALSRLIRNHGVNIIDSTPLLLNEFNKVEDLGPFDIIISGGDVLKAEYVDNLLPAGRVYNTYGPTETTVCVAFYPYYMYSDKLEPNTSIPIGKPISNYRVYILDAHLKLQPIGVVGELCVSGVGVARGYLNRPELTAEKFIDLSEQAIRVTFPTFHSPTHPLTHSALYRTGDLARWLPDGNIEFSGRKDTQVKIRGFRIELEEIENRLLKYDGISQSAVIPGADENGDKYLIAYVTADSNVGMDNLKDSLAKQLPVYMIPAFFVRLNQIPLTPNGKVNVKALPEPEITSAIEYVEPRNQVQERIRDIWQEILGIERIGIYDNFFEIGGHSLRGIQVVNALHSEFDVKVPLAELFRTPSIAGLWEYIENASESKYVSIKEVEKKDFYVMSSAQKRMYILQQVDVETIAYNMPQFIPLEQAPVREKLENTFKKLIERHESLKASFYLVEGEPVQRICDEVEFKIQRYDAGSSLEKITKNFVRPFDLSRAPLLRVGLIQEGITGDNHILMLDMHHIITDGISQDIFIKDFMSLYRGEKPPPLRIHYKDYAEWQDSEEQRSALKEQETYWLKEFAGEIPVSNLPTDFKRPAVQDFAGSYLNFAISREETEGLRNLALKQDLSLYMLLLALFNVMLSKLSGSEDIITGTLIAGRNHADLQGVMGMFVNTLPLRTCPVGQKSVSAYFLETREKTLRAFENQDYQFENLVEQVTVNRDAGRNPLFDVMFLLDDQDDVVMDYWEDRENEEEAWYEHAYRVSKFDLTMGAVETSEKLLFSFQYSTALFIAETIRRFAGYFKTIIAAIIRDPGKRISEIEIITEEEKEQVMIEFNRTEARYPAGKTIHRLFEEQAERTPDGVSIVGKKERSGESVQLTYGELNRKSHRLARLLRERGVVPNTIVGIMMERSLEMMIGILGILKAGGAYLPIDPDYPRERIDFMLKDSGAGILLSEVSKVSEVSKGIEVIDLSLLIAANEGIEPTHLTHLTHPTHLCYIIYTSGSTGKPKGVMVEHQSLVNLCCWHVQNFEITGRDRASQYASCGFDASIWEIFPYLLRGASLHIINEDIKFDIERVNEYFEKHHITIAFLPTPFYEQFMRIDNHSLRVLLTGGDKLRNFEAGNYQLYNNYGPTESTVVASSCLLEYRTDNIPIGNPINNNRIYILDSGSLQLQPVGVAGELCIGGAGLARGYLNRLELTAEQFLSVSYRTYSSQRIYKTGDLARWLTDGNIEFLGRIDQQVKIRGYRIELGEIESRLIKHTDIKEAVVLARENNRGDKYLCSYIVPESVSEGVPGVVLAGKLKELKEYLSMSLPDYMVPSYFMELAELPLTASGKIDRRELPVPGMEAGKEYIAPGNAMEMELVRIWSEVLGIEKDVIGIDNNFFHLGGHSLSATIMSTRIHKALQVRVPLAEVFKTPTVRGLAGYIKEAALDRYDSIEPVEKKEYYRLSSAQKRLYILQQMEADGIGYNMPEVIPLAEEPDIEKLEETFIRLIERHESLRTSFGMRDDQPVQKIHDHVEFEIEAIQNSFVRPFDLSRAPLLRVGLVTAVKGRYLLLVDMHHIISDGVSHEILVQDFMLLDREEELAPLRVQYKDYAGWQNRPEQGKAIRHQESYWLNEFSGDIPVLQLPCDYARPAHQSFAGNTLLFEIGGEESSILRRLALESGATLYMVLLAVTNVFLYKLGNQEDIVMGTPVAGRRHADLEKIIGMFVNTLALRNYPAGDKSFKGFVREVKSRAVEAFDNQEYQFEDLVEKVEVSRDAGRNPLFDVMFLFREGREYPGDSDSDKVEGTDAVEMEKEGAGLDGTAKFDLTIAGMDAGDRLHFSFQYCTKLFKERTVRRFIAYFKKVVSDIAEDAARHISGIEIILAEEKQQILYEFNGTGFEYPVEKTVHELFAEQAERTPDSAAVSGVEQLQITYHELNGKSDLLAGLLREKGLKPGGIAAIMTERSVEMIIGILGILKAGGAYLPIEPGYPQERIDFILKDSNARVLLKKSEIRISKFETNPNDQNSNDQNKISTLIVLNFEHLNFEFVSDFEFRASNLSSSNLSYIIYTSGSTGIPKGVMIEHQSLVNLCCWHVQNFEITGRDRASQYASFGFDASIWEIFPYLLRGASLHIINEDIKFDIERVNEYFEKHHITIAFLPTPFYEQFMRIDNHSLRVLLTGGDKLRNFEAGNYQLYNNYGPTENTVVASSCLLEYRTDNIPIGNPINNNRIYILDSGSLQLQPVGVAGELCIGGAGLARGYLNRPELTAEQFLSVSYRTYSSQRIYKTGDLARWLTDGNIEFLGRIDQQVKIRGYRIELGEIETQLLRHKDIKEALVLARENEMGDKYLCTYIVSNMGEVVELKLKEYLSGLLPDYMIPSYFMEIEKLPLTPSGKIDRPALPEPGPGPGEGYMAPGNPVEEKLVEIWAEVLGLEPNIIGIEANFFRLGGHSLKATILMSRIYPEFEVRIPLVEIFKRPSIKLLAEYIEKAAPEVAGIRDENLVLLKKKTGNGGNIFFIHDGSGEVEGYIEFCHHLAADLDYWGIRADRLEDYAPRQVSIEEVAARYIEKIKAIQTHGPYNLAGWSMGGTIAFEMVRQLEQMGDSIAFFAMIDVVTPHSDLLKGMKRDFTLEAELNFIQHYLADIQMKENFANVTDIHQLWTAVKDYLETENVAPDAIRSVITRYEALVLPDYHQLTVSALINFMNIGRTFSNARATYVPVGKIDTQIHYFGASLSARLNNERDKWHDYCKKPMKVYTIDGDHFSIFKMPAVAGFSKIFAAVIAGV